MLLLLLWKEKPSSWHACVCACVLLWRLVGCLLFSVPECTQPTEKRRGENWGKRARGFLALEREREKEKIRILRQQRRNTRAGMQYVHVCTAAAHL